MDAWSRSFGPGSLHLVQGDITRCQTDAIVNAANSALAGGGGVDGAIHRAAGPELLAACQEIVQRDGRLPAGQAVITPGFHLLARHVIHTVGPIWRGGGQNEKAILESAYVQSLLRAREYGCRTVAFPAISCGAYGFPLELAAPIALGALARGLEQGDVETIYMYVFSADSLREWLDQAEALFGA